MIQKKIPIIIPSYEPDEKLLALLAQLSEAQCEPIVLVDDGSGEAYHTYFERAKEEYHCTVLTHSVNMGKGRALKDAFDYCLQTYPDSIGCVTADSDGQHTVACIQACMEALQEHPQSLVLGCRSFDEANVPKRSEFGNKCTRTVMKYLAGVSVSDTQTGLRAIPSAFMQILLQVSGDRFEFETNMLMETKTHKIPIVEVPIQTVYIEENKTSHFHPIVDSARIYFIFAKFLFSSLSSSVLDLVLFTLFCYLLKQQKFDEGLYIACATVMARVLSALYNYFINYKIVFKSRSSVGKTIGKYLILAVVQMACSAFLVSVLYPLFGGAEVFVKVPVDVFLFFISFIIQREFVYR